MLRTLFQLFAWHYTNGNLARAEAVVRDILTVVRDDRISLQFLGLVYYRTGRVAEAIRVFEAGGPGPGLSADLASEPGDDFLSRNGYSAAAACHVESTRRNPDLAQAWHDLGLVLSELGLRDQGEHALRYARLAHPQALEALRTGGLPAWPMDSHPAAARAGLHPWPPEQDARGV